MVSDHKLDKLLGPAGTFSGYFLMLFGILGAYFFALPWLLLAAAGMFMAFTYDGTKIDFSSRKIKNYTCFFGLLKIGRWHNVDSFKKFHIVRSKRTYTTYSRANIPLTLKNSDIRLLLLNENGSLKITVNKFNSFEAARKEMSELIRNLQITELKEWI
ncbi:MAG: hypothetical protein A2V50_04490 [Bacteroidetes bacterium RBG_19FT_COMBO_42_10]|nr:MAG: hypothetical protein A2V50_04490 [Bacteroidetes bacterium RBG_19FT_COMBO_42_10]